MDEVLQLYETLNMFYILFGGCVLGLLGTNICTVGIMQFFKLQLFVNPRRFLITGNSVLCYLLLICRYLKSIYRNQCQIRSGFNSVGRFSSVKLHTMESESKSFESLHCDKCIWRSGNILCYSWEHYQL